MIRSFILSLLILFAACQGVLLSQDIQTLISEGDAYAGKFDHKKAIDRYKKALALSETNYEVLWKLSREYVDLAEHMPADNEKQEEAQLKTYEKALLYANRTVKGHPEKMMGYLRRAIANGRVALFKGVFSVIGIVNDVREDCEKAIKLNTEGKQELAVAHYVLARTHAKVCEKPYLLRLPLGLGWGDEDDATEGYTKAISLNSGFIMFRLDAARHYVELDELPKAMEHLRKIQYLDMQDEDDPRFRKEAAHLLRKIKEE